jgi:predicted dehydrogenase
VAGGRGTVELSRTRALPNTAWISGEHGSLEVSLIENRVITDPSTIAQQVVAELRADRLPQQSFEDLFVGQLEAWLRTVAGEDGVAVPATEALATMRLSSDCYGIRQPLEMNWMQVRLNAGGKS